MIWSALLGYLMGSLPSADAVARLRGIDLRSAGSGNPGTANALRIGGARTAALVLLLDLAKGAAAAVAGRAIAGDPAGAAAAVAAILGQVRNPWFGFRGGKGLGVTGGGALVLWPLGMAATLIPIGLAAKALGAARGAMIGLGVIGGLGVVWAAREWPVAWGVAPDDTLVWFILGVLAVTTPKFAGDALRGSAVRR